jgi:hypothetical protein
MKIKMKGRVSGRYKLVVRDASTMEITKELDWFDNLVLDSGLNRLGTGAIINFAQVGTSNTAPAVGQTALSAYVAGTSDAQEAVGGNTGAPDYAKTYRYRFRFGVGVAAGNLSEVGVGWAAVGSLFSRALLVDGLGAPTTITVLPTEVLDVWYELRTYPNQVDVVTTNVAIGPNLHTVTIRPNLIGANGAVFSSGDDPRFGFYGHAGAAVYSGAIVAMTSTPAGSLGGSDSRVVASYSNNSLKRSIALTWGLAVGNGSVQAAVVNECVGSYQIGFSPPIPKTNLTTLTLSFEWTWARH